MRSPALAFVSLLLTPACTFVVHMHCNWNQLVWSSVEPTTEARQLTIDCEPGNTTVCLQVDSDARLGELSLQLVDATGCERHREVLPSGEHHQILNWPGQPGKWCLTAQATGFAGNWSVNLTMIAAP